jgi:hypothetical protein
LDDTQLAAGPDRICPGSKLFRKALFSPFVSNSRLQYDVLRGVREGSEPPRSEAKSKPTSTENS